MHAVGTIVRYEWDFDGDDEYDWSSQVSGDTTHIYQKTGTYQAKFRITTDNGARRTDYKTFLVMPSQSQYVFGRLLLSLLIPLFAVVSVVSIDYRRGKLSHILVYTGFYFSFAGALYTLILPFLNIPPL